MKQPTKDTLREQLAIAADEIIRLKGELAWLTDGATVILYREPVPMYVFGRKPWWHRLWDKCKAVLGRG